MDYFNKVNISSPFSCFYGTEIEKIPPKLKHQELINAAGDIIENIESGEKLKIKEIRKNEKSSTNPEYGFNKTVRFEKKRIFRTENQKKEYLFGIREIKGVIFRENKKNR